MKTSGTWAKKYELIQVEEEIPDQELIRLSYVKQVNADIICL